MSVNLFTSCAIMFIRANRCRNTCPVGNRRWQLSGRFMNDFRVIGAGQGRHTVEVRSDHSDSCHRRLPTGHVLRHPLARMTAPELNKITKHGALLFLPSCLPNYKYTYLSCMNYFFQTSTGGCALPNQVKSIETDGYTPNGALWAPSQHVYT